MFNDKYPGDLIYYYFLGRKYGATPANAMEWAIQWVKWWSTGEGKSPAFTLKGVDV